jgi:hypothetical protein
MVAVLGYGTCLEGRRKVEIIRPYDLGLQSLLPLLPTEPPPALPYKIHQLNGTREEAGLQARLVLLHLSGVFTLCHLSSQVYIWNTSAT